MAESKVYAFPMSSEALDRQVDLLLAHRQEVEVTGVKNAFGLIGALMRKRMQLLEVPGFYSGSFHCVGQISGDRMEVPSVRILSLNAAREFSVRVITLRLVHEGVQFSLMGEDVFKFENSTLSYRPCRGWSFVKDEAMDPFCGWIFVRKDDLKD